MNVIRRIFAIPFRALFGSLSLAIFLWVFVKLSVSYEYEFQIPIVPLNIREGKALSQEIPETAEIVLEGKGSTLMALRWFWGSEIQFNLNLITIQSFWDCPTEKYASWISIPPGYEVTLKNINYPDTIRVRLENKLEKWCTISTDSIKVVPLEGYVQVGGIQFDPDSVLISGPQSIVHKISTIATEPQSFLSVKDDISKTLDLQKPRTGLITYDIEKTNLSVEIQKLGETILENIEIQVENVPRGYTVSVLPPHIEIYVRGGVKYLQSLKSTDFTVFVNFRNRWKHQQQYREKAEILYPENIVAYEVMPDSITVMVE